MKREKHPDLKAVSQSLGMVFIVIGLLGLVPLLVSLFYNEDITPFMAVSVLPLAAGMVITRFYQGEIDLRVKHAAIAAALTYLIAAILGAVPFMYYGMGLLDSVFEAMSGWTTTGLTMIADVEAMPRSLLFWRSFMQWLGGVGVIVLMLVILAGTGSAAEKLYQAEARKDRIKPRLLSTVRLIWWIYLIYSLAGILLYYLAGMTVFDAVNHSLSMLSTGGFSTRNLNIESFGSFGIELVTILIMMLGATNFLVHYKVLTGRRSALFRDLETRSLFLITILGALVLFLKVPSLRASLFQAVSAITTTGSSSIDVTALGEFPKLAMSFMMMVGANTGSTGGGFKIIRFIIVLKLMAWWIKEKLLPEHAVITKKLSGVELTSENLQEPAVFLLLYLFIFSLGTLAFTYMGYPTVDAIFEVVSAQSNVGLSAGITRAGLEPLGKALLIFHMWIGRLEIIPVLVLAESILRIRPKKRPKEIL